MHIKLQDSAKGLWAAFLCYGLWGAFPIYWKQIDHIPSLEVVLHRVWWSFILLLGIMLATRRLGHCLRLLRDKKVFLTLLASGLMISVNWYTFIWAVNNQHILASSLGYFLNPVLNMLCGVLLFKDTLSRPQWLAVLLAAAGVAVQIIIVGNIPVISLILAITFTIYGVIRKAAPVGALDGMFIETLLMAPIILLCLFMLGFNNELYFGVQTTLSDNFFLIGGGLVTTLPLLLFTYGARHLRLTTLGLIQYLSPSFSFLIGIFIYHEPLSPGYLFSFILIWAALALYTLASIRQHRMLHKLMKKQG